MNDRHAYLIMCHNNFEIFEKLLCLLDHEKNDIYVHVDKKVNNFNKKKYCDIVQKSNICFVESVQVNWGGTQLLMQK